MMHLMTYYTVEETSYKLEVGYGNFPVILVATFTVTVKSRAKEMSIPATSDPTTISRYITSNDSTQIWASSSGNPSNPPLIFIHGVSCTSIVFDGQFSDSQLLENLYLIRYELRGHGRSGYPKNEVAYESKRYAEDFKAVCEEFEIVGPDCKVFICAWSIGAQIVVDIIQAYGTSKIAGIIFPGGPVLNRYLQLTYNNPSSDELYLSTDTNILSSSAITFVDSCFSDPSILPFEIKLQWIGGFLMQPPMIRKWTWERGQEVDRWENEVKNGRVPYLLIMGMEDSHFRARECIECCRKNLGDMLEVVELEGVGHAPFIERKEDCNRWMLEFVQKHSARLNE
ncbi:Alpha/Beta hydrolase protein [Abortiporus biennis]|nr:Alpha/Beta hydrolase protein [Abortiporus biennis]